MKDRKLVCGIGITDTTTRENGKILKSYNTWTHVINRCYSVKVQIKNPTYIGCSVCKEWLTFSNFKTWFDQNYISGYQLDKDILNRGNKEYSPINCRFVPSQINTILTDCGAARGKYQQGVVWNKKVQKYQARCAIFNKLTHLGYFDTEIEAFNAYKEFKEAHIKQTAEEYYNAGKIRWDIYTALQNWTI